MNEQSQYNFAPTFFVMLTGLLVAALPLSWVWLRQRQADPEQRWRAVAMITLFLTFDLVVFGAFTRLTDSGLGCPDWPGCYGHASPVGAQVHISAAQTAMPSGPVTHDKAWVEMVHRYLATAVGALILLLASRSWWVRWKGRSAHLRGHNDHSDEDAGSRARATWTLIWVCVQGAFGALTVTMKLWPAIVTLHLLGGMGLLVLLCHQVVRRGYSPELLPRTRALLWLTFALLWIQIALGGWVSTNYAVLACTEFPACQNSWWPKMHFAQGFELWRPLGQSAHGAIIGFDALTAIHYTHRLASYVVLIALALTAWALLRTSSLRRQGRYLAVLLLLQLATGLANVLLGWPLLAALLHTGGAGAMLVVLSWVLAASSCRQSAHPTSSAKYTVVKPLITDPTSTSRSRQTT